MRKSTIQQDIVFPNIGKDDKLESVGCCIKLNTSSYQYDPDDRHKIERLSKILLKNVKQAWLVIQRKSRRYKKRPDSLFIPRALNQGRNEVYKNYLPMLKNMKIWSYINLNVPIESIPGQKIEARLTQITNRKYRQGFDAFKSFSMKQTRKMNRQSQYFNSGSKEIRHKIKQQSKQLNYDGPINITFQTVYLHSQRQMKSYSKKKITNQQLTGRQTKTKQKKFDFGHQYDSSQNNCNNSKFLSAFDIDYQAEKARTSSKNRIKSKFKNKLDQKERISIPNEEESCSFCNIINSFDKEKKRVSQLVTAQTFLQDQY